MSLAPHEVSDTDAAQLRFLRRLVITLMIVMICGLILIVGVVVIRIAPSGPDLPGRLELPEGAAAPMAFTAGRDWIAIVTEGDEILIYDRLSGQLRQTLRIGSAE